MTSRPLKELSEEDRILWRRVTDTVTPVTVRERISRADFASFLESVDNKEEISAPGAIPSPTKTSDRCQAAAPVQKARLAIDRPVHDKISKGRVQLDARIDLHGMTQHQAHTMLLNFLHQAWQHHLRHVLVITGKGSSLGSDGILNRAVPEWFATPSFRPYVSGYSLAARHHGGRGALYVRLRRHTEGKKS
jgi:DNA-nicking Smr family endonuclease